MIPVGSDDTHRAMWRRHRYGSREPNRDPYKCQHSSVVRIGKKYYCKKHAGVVALAMWLRGELMEKPQ